MFCPADGTLCGETPGASDCHTCFTCWAHWVVEGEAYSLPPSGEECPSCGRVIPHELSAFKAVFADAVISG